MPSRQERRKEERDAAKAGARAGAKAEAAGAAAARAAHVLEDPSGDWTAQTGDCGVLLEALGSEAVRQLADDGNRAAQFSQGYKLMSEAGIDAGATGGLGASGRSPKADVGLSMSLYIDTFQAAHQVVVLMLM